MTENYRGCYEYLSAQYPEVGGYEFYKELFPDMRKTAAARSSSAWLVEVTIRNGANQHRSCAPAMW